MGGFTLVELVLVIIISGVVFTATPVLFFHGVKTLVFLPKTLAVNDAAAEVLHQVIEGGFSILGGPPTVRGLRFASRTLPTGGTASQPALWLAEAGRIGFLTSNGQYVLIRLDAEQVKRSLPAVASCTPAIGTEETLPYQAAGNVRILPTGSFFRYYNQSGVEVAPACPPGSAIRRVDIAFVAQTGNGAFDDGDAREEIATSVAIRVP